MSEILVIGSLNMDVSVQMDRMPQKGETVRGAGYAENPGGKGANQAYAAGSLGGSVAMLGCVGDDAYGRALTEQLRRGGVDVSALEAAPDAATGTAFIFTDAAADNSIVIIGGANERCTVEYVQRHEDLLARCDTVLLQLEIPLETVCWVIRRASQLGKRIVLDPAPARGDIPADVVRLVSILTPNETELAALTGRRVETEEEIRLAAAELLEQGVEYVIVTMGARGALVMGRDGTHLIPTRPVRAVDTTAAGDCFNGALAVELSRGADMAQAVAFANAAASLSTTRRGAQSSIPRREEVEPLG